MLHKKVLDFCAQLDNKLPSIEDWGPEVLEPWLFELETFYVSVQ